MTEPPDQTEPIWLTTKQAAARAQCSAGTIWLAVRAEKLRVARAGRNLRFRPAWIDTWLETAGELVEGTR